MNLFDALGLGMGSSFAAADQFRQQYEAMERLRFMHEAQVRAKHAADFSGPIIDAEYEVIERKLLPPR